MFIESTYQKLYEQNTLNTKSKNHQLMEFEGTKPVKCYVKTEVSILSAFRLNHVIWNRDKIPAQMDVMLWTSAPNTAIETTAEGVVYKDIQFRYEDNVIELYDDKDVEVFERLNKGLLADERLIEYDETIDYVYAVVGYTNDRNRRPIYRLVEKERRDTRVFKPATVKRG